MISLFQQIRKIDHYDVGKLFDFPSLTDSSCNIIIVFQDVILDLVSEGQVSENGDDGVTERRGRESGADDEDPVFDGPLLQRGVNRNSTHVALVGEGDGRNCIEHFHATFG